VGLDAEAVSVLDDLGRAIHDEAARYDILVTRVERQYLDDGIEAELAYHGLFGVVRIEGEALYSAASNAAARAELVRTETRALCEQMRCAIAAPAGSVLVELGAPCPTCDRAQIVKIVLGANFTCTRGTEHEWPEIAHRYRRGEPARSLGALTERFASPPTARARSRPGCRR